MNDRRNVSKRDWTWGAISTVCRMNTKEKQLFRMDTKVSCPELFGTTRNVRLKADIIIKRRGGEPANQD